MNQPDVSEPGASAHALQVRTWASMKDWAALEGLLQEKKPLITAEAVIEVAKQHAAPNEALARFVLMLSCHDSSTLLHRYTCSWQPPCDQHAAGLKLALTCLCSLLRGQIIEAHARRRSQG